MGWTTIGWMSISMHIGISKATTPRDVALDPSPFPAFHVTLGKGLNSFKNTTWLIIMAHDSSPFVSGIIMDYHGLPWITMDYRHHELGTTHEPSMKHPEKPLRASG